MKNSLVLLITLTCTSSVISRFLQSGESLVEPNPKTFQNGLLCGECIRRGYTYCRTKANGGEHGTTVTSGSFCKNSAYLSSGADYNSIN